MAITAEERAQLEAALPNFGTSEKLQYLAERKLLPQQQQDMESFENAPLLTQMRRSVFGHTSREQALIKRQEEALVPFEQEQKLRAVLGPILQTPMTELMNSSVGHNIMPTPSQVGMLPSGSMDVPQHLVPNTFDIDELMARKPAGMTPSNIAFGRPGSVVSRPMSEPVMPPTRELDTYAPSILPDAKPTMLQALQAHAQLDPSVLAANVKQTVPKGAKDDILEVGGVPYQIQHGENGQKILTPLPGAQPKVDEDIAKVEALMGKSGIDKTGPIGQKVYKDYLDKITTRSEGVNVNVNTMDTASNEAQKKFMDSARTTYDQLKSAPTLLANIQKAKALIPGARGFMGTGGETLLDATKFLNNRLGLKIATEGIKNAEELRSRIFFNLMDNLKKMDASPSQQQQQVMQDALGKLGTDPNALSNVLDAYADTIRGKVDAYNTEVSGAEGRGVKFPYKPQIVLEKAASGDALTSAEQRELNELRKRYGR